MLSTTEQRTSKPTQSSAQDGRQALRAAKLRKRFYRAIAAEINRAAKYYDSIIQLTPLAADNGTLLDLLDNDHKSTAQTSSELPDSAGNQSQRHIVLLNGNFNYDLDIQSTLASIKSHLSRQTRLVVVAYNPYLGWLYKLANYLGLRTFEPPVSFLTAADVGNLAKLAGYELVRSRPVTAFPFKFFGLGDLINRLMPALPVLQWLCLAHVLTLRPVIAERAKPSLSIVIPARNERGNIEGALQRLPAFEGTKTEIIFVEGHSTDSTWEEIQRVVPLYQHRFPIKAFKQSGKGKSDAVRLGFAKAENDVLVILDADLSVPPELLPRFYDGYVNGLADFINGSRLLYPIEGKAMRPLNKIGNIFFAKALSHVLGVRLTDSLCGTKLFSRDSYMRFVQWRNDFGDFDPFGDFELLFPAAVLGLGIIDIPLRYRDRVYGDTNISRFRHGLMLLKMTAIGLLRIALGSA